MGMIEKTAVSSITLIENATIDPTKLQEIGATISGTAKTVTIDDIVAAEGERGPNAATSQKTFKTAFIFITRPGTFLGAEPAGIEMLRNAWAGRFVELTHGKGSIADVTPTLSLTVTSPSEGQTISGADVMVRGTLINSTGNETGVTVNGMVATVCGNQFIANHVPLSEGQNTITIASTDTAGNTGSTSITINSVTTGNYLRLISNIESGISPLEVLLRVDGSFNLTASNLGVAGPVQPEVLSAAPEEYKLRFTVEGVYYVTVTASGPDGLMYQDTIAITVLNRNQLDMLLKGKWEGMKEKLRNRDIDGSLVYFHDGSKESYRQAFKLILDDLPQIVSDMLGVEMIYVKDDLAKYRIRRNQNINEMNQTFTYYIYFLRDRNGAWKLNRF
jgi:hypothetical protein